MNFKTTIANYFLLSLFSFVFLFSFISAENINGTEWWVLNITNETVDVNGTTYGNVSNYTVNPDINNFPQFDVLTTMDATNWWAEVQLNTTEINFGNVQKGNATRLEYKIWARGNVDINVTPVLKSTNDVVFSNLQFSRTPSSNYKSIGEYSMRFNLTNNTGNWLGIGPSSMELRNPNQTTNGKQYIMLNLKNFEGIVPFDEAHQNTVKFVITPIWSSVEPMSKEKVYREYVDL